MALARRFTQGDDLRFYVYVLKHNGTPIWTGMGTGIRHEIRAIAPPPQRLTPSGNISCTIYARSEIVFSNLTWAEAAEKESDLIEEFGLVCDGTGPLFNRAYGAGCHEQSRLAR